MGKKMGTLALASLALLLTACSGHAPISEADYLASVEDLASFGGMSADDLIQYGQDYCNYLRDYGEGTDEGRERAAQLFLAVDGERGGNVLETALVAGSAVQRFCPEFRTD